MSDDAKNREVVRAAGRSCVIYFGDGVVCACDGRVGYLMCYFLIFVSADALAPAAASSKRRSGS